MTRPFEYIRNYLKDKIERIRKLDDFIHSQGDSFVTWIIGFSFTGLLFIVANFDKFQTKSPTKAIVICLFISIILGIVFRILSFLITIFQKSLDDYFFGLSSDQEMTPIYLDEDLEKLQFLDLLSLIKNDFGDEIYPDANSNTVIHLPENLRKSEEKRLREHYLHLVEHSKKEFLIAINHIAEIDETAYKINKEKTLAKLTDLKKTFENANIGYHQKRWYLARFVVYLVCLLSFMTAVSILCLSMIMMLQ